VDEGGGREGGRRGIESDGKLKWILEYFHSFLHRIKIIWTDNKARRAETCTEYKYCIFKGTLLACAAYGTILDFFIANKLLRVMHKNFINACSTNLCGLNNGGVRV
jgi:hypothetical protein